MNYLVALFFLTISCGKKTDKPTLIDRPKSQQEGDSPASGSQIEAKLEKCFKLEVYTKNLHFYKKNYFAYRAGATHLISRSDSYKPSLDQILDIYKSCVVPVSGIYTEDAHIR